MGKEKQMNEIESKITKSFKEHPRRRNCTLPSGIEFTSSAPDVVTMSLSPSAIGLNSESKKNANMQKDCAAFEAWAFFIYRYYLHESGKIYLCVNDSAGTAKSNVGTGCSGHFNRFLYRAMKFSEQYDWFEMSDVLTAKVAEFKQYISDPDKMFLNNVPNKKTKRSSEEDENPETISDSSEQGTGSGSMSSSALESYVESCFCDAPELLRKIAGNKIGNNKIYAQLPVGLFEGKTHGVPSVFTGKKSAIDMWTRDDNTIHIFELKADNKEVGIISELMFYANYIYDMYVDQGNRFHPQDNKEAERGYDKLVSDPPLKNVCAYMLTNKLHPLIDEEVLKLMNAPGIIHYERLNYKFNVSICEQ